MSRALVAADLFCGAGGSSTGLALAAEASGRTVDLVAVNHWDVAVATHAANHPNARHIHGHLDGIDPRKVFPGGKLDVLVASPECTHFSTARGGKPKSDQSRAGAWHVVHWASALRPDHIVVENVAEMRTWGPMTPNGQIIKSRAGETYRAWLAALASLGYTVEDRVLNAADYGDPTTRRRLFVRARLGKRRPVWPVQSHAKPQADRLFDDGLLPWRTARDAVIDWDVKGRSIFGRRKPLAEKTVARIAEGLRRYGGEAAAPFLLHLTHSGRLRSLDEPVPTITCANRGELGIVQPFMVPFYGERDGQPPRTHSVVEPVPTLPASPKFGLCEPFMLGQQSGATPRPVSQPTPTLSTKGAVSLVEPTIVSFYGNGQAHSIHAPLPTATTKDRFGLVDPRPALDILFRMLTPRELARAMGFPEGYVFTGTHTDQVRQVGNAVAVGMSTALCAAMLEAQRKVAA